MKIIADIGSNWFSLDDCLKSIEVLADLGVTSAKFQYFTFEKLYGFVDPYDHPKPGLYREWIDILAIECRKKRIEFMCSVFDSDDVKMISQHCTTFKVASPEISDLDLLHAYAEIFDPSKHEIYISTGCATIEDLKNADNIFEGKQVFMACDSSYPAKGVPLNHMYYLYYNYPDFGISDHSLDTSYNIKMAEMLECKAYEKHFKLNKIRSHSPDSAHSLNVDEWQYMMGRYAEEGWKYQKKPFKRIKKNNGWYRPGPK